MTWVHKSLIFAPSGLFPWSQSHAQVPTAIVMSDHIRIYYATRDSQGRSSTSFINVSKEDPSKVLYVHDKPVLLLGNPGTHDEDGVMVGSVINNHNEILLYYTGWSRGHTVPYRVSIGLAKSIDEGVSFARVFEGPIVDRTPLEPYMTMSPNVIFDGIKWRMWYGSGVGWVMVNGKNEPLYLIKYAEGDDGINWVQTNITCINPLHQMEANTRPSVLINSLSEFEMWFSFRHSVDYRNGAGSYRIGYATSKDGRRWNRDKSFFDLDQSREDWNNHMIAYPSVLVCNEKKIMFYNGNGFGQSGFGYAIWRD